MSPIFLNRKAPKWGVFTVQAMKEGREFLHAGRYPEAEEVFRRIVEEHPGHPQALNLLGLTMHYLDDNAGAIACMKKSIEIDASIAGFYINLGFPYLALLDWGEAASCFEKAVRLKGDSPAALSNLALALWRMGKVDEAWPYCQKALEIEPGRVDSLCLFGNLLCEKLNFAEAEKYYAETLRRSPGHEEALKGYAEVLMWTIKESYDPAIGQVLLDCFKLNVVAPDYLARPMAKQLRGKHRLDERLEEICADVSPHLRALASDEMLVLYLEKAQNIDGGIEILLTAIRRAFLNSAPGDWPDFGAEMRLARALSKQCFMNEYVFLTEAEEEERLSALREHVGRRVEAGEAPSPELEHGLLILSMYAPLYRLPDAEKIGAFPLEDWSLPLHDLISRQLHEPLKEEALKAGLERIGEIEDSVSRAVQAQYEENPYPRWTTVPQLHTVRLDAFFRENFPHFSPPSFLEGSFEVLVPGCGTRQPIEAAMKYAKGNVLAVDLSQSSLAHARRVAEAAGIQNLRFAQGDVMNLASLDQKFQVIECTGVLHHMEDPLAGWRVLTDLLVDGGMMQIGLYSETARRPVVQAREKIRARDMEPTQENIRKFRREIIAGGEQAGELSNLLNSRDFFSMSGCRDFLFHVQERRFTIPQIREALDNLGLRFVGFIFMNPWVKVAYGKEFPGDPHMTDLACWEAFEEKEPYAFAAMYDFLCVKEGG
ncbi:MAG: tetratricopeptide repeat protein [bacterium]|nr:tetratricopeptide repeat protein [bacterium]